MERKLEAPKSDADSVLLRGLDRERPADDPILTDLIDRLKTGSPEPMAAATRDEAWRGLIQPADDPDLLGRLGGYEIIEPVATGGMGTVLKARDPELDREVAIKVLDPELAANSTARERFLREARSAAKLEHENILPIHGVHEADGVPYFAMRLAPGGSLQDALDRGETFDIDRLKAIAAGVAEALGAAHAEGIIHRDIKPANILFDETGKHIWVCDFGIARSTEDPGLTYTGTVAGTPQYMSPEQADGKELDGRSDLFSLGVVLFRCASGAQAFGGNTTASVLKSVAHDEPDLDSLGQAKWFTALLGNLLAKNPCERPDDAAAVLRSIEAERAPRPQVGQRKNPIALVAIGVVALSGLAFLVPAVRDALNGATPSTSATATAAVVNEQTGEPFDDLESAIAQAQDGSTLQLRGRFEIEEQLNTPPDLTINFRAAGGASPVIVAMGKENHALFIRGSSTVSGIRFLRPQAMKRGQPILGIHANGGEILVEDCMFESPNTNDPELGHRALCVTQFTSATIRRCEFRVPGGHAILTGSRVEKLAIEDSAIIASAAVEHRSLPDDPRCALSIERSVLLCVDAVVRDPQKDFAPLDVSVSGNISHLLRAGFWLADIEASQLPGLITWKGHNNVYRGNCPIVRTYRDRAGSGFEAISINTTAERATIFTETGMHIDTGAVFYPRGPLDISGLNLEEATAADLLPRLRDGIQSPAIATLEHFARKKAP